MSTNLGLRLTEGDILIMRLGNCEIKTRDNPISAVDLMFKVAVEGFRLRMKFRTTQPQLDAIQVLFAFP